MKLGQRDIYVQGRKFWEVQVVRDVADEPCVQVAWGRRGTKGGVKTWRFFSTLSAVDDAEERALAKRRKGYQFARTSQDAAMYGDLEAEKVRRELDLSGARRPLSEMIARALTPFSASGLAPATQQRFGHRVSFQPAAGMYSCAVCGDAWTEQEVAASSRTIMAGRCWGPNAIEAVRREGGVEIHLRIDRPKRPPPVGRLGGERRVSFDDD